MRRTAAVALALLAAVAVAQSPMYSDYPWGLVQNGVDQGPVWNLNCITPGLSCTVDGGNGTVSVNVAGGGGALADAGFITWYADPGLINERVLSAGNYTVADFGTAGQAQVDWQHGLTCSSGQALTTASTSTLQCTSTITASDLNCSGCVSDAELASNYSGVGVCTNQFVRAVNDNAGPTCTSVALGSDVSGILPQPNGGTGTGALTCGTAQYLTSNGTAYSCSQGVNGSGVAGQATYWTGTYALSGESVYTYDATNNRLHVGAAAADTGSVNGYATTTYALVARNAITENGGGSIKALNSSVTGYAGLDLFDDGDTARQAAVAYGSRTHSVTDKRNAFYVDYLANAAGFSVWGGSTLNSRFDSTGLGLGRIPTAKLDVYDGDVLQENDTSAIHVQRTYSAVAAIAGFVSLQRSKSGTLGTNTIVASGDALGALLWSGANGAAFSNAASIRAEVYGTPGAANDMPGRLLFLTSADASATPTERMRISSTGAVTVPSTGTLGVGSSTWASNGNDVFINTNGASVIYLRPNGSGSTTWQYEASSTSTYHRWLGAAGAELARLTGTGLGVGVTPSVKLHVAGNGNVFRMQGTDHAYMEFYPAGGTTRYGYFGHANASTNEITLANERSTGNLIFDTNAGNYRFTDFNGGGTTGASIDNDGDLIRTPSDARLKERVVDFAGALDAVLAMRPVRFHWRDARKYGTRQDVGFLAQEMAVCLPEVVSSNPDGTLSLDYSKVVPVLAGAVQELHTQKAALEQRVQTAEDRLAQLEARLASIEAWSGIGGCPEGCRP